MHRAQRHCPSLCVSASEKKCKINNKKWKNKIKKNDWVKIENQNRTRRIIIDTTNEYLSEVEVEEEGFFGLGNLNTKNLRYFLHLAIDLSVFHLIGYYRFHSSSSSTFLSVSLSGNFRFLLLHSPNSEASTTRNGSYGDAFKVLLTNQQMTRVLSLCNRFFIVITEWNGTSLLFIFFLSHSNFSTISLWNSLFFFLNILINFIIINIFFLSLYINQNCFN